MKLIIKLVHDYKELILHDVDRAKTLSTIPFAILTVIVRPLNPTNTKIITSIIANKKNKGHITCTS